MGRKNVTAPFRSWLLSLADEIARVSDLTGKPITSPDPGTDHRRKLLEALGVEIDPPDAEAPLLEP